MHYTSLFYLCHFFYSRLPMVSLPSCLPSRFFKLFAHLKKHVRLHVIFLSHTSCLMRKTNLLSSHARILLHIDSDFMFFPFVYIVIPRGKLLRFHLISPLLLHIAAYHPSSPLLLRRATEIISFLPSNQKFSLRWEFWDRTLSFLLWRLVSLRDVQ